MNEGKRERGGGGVKVGQDLCTSAGGGGRGWVKKYERGGSAQKRQVVELEKEG